MIPKEKILEIAKSLLAKTRADETRWQSTQFGEGTPGYTLALPTAFISVALFPDENGPDSARIFLYNEHREVVGRLYAEDGEPEFKEITALIDEAERACTKWDKVVKDIDEALKQKGPIGEPPDELPW